MTVGPQRQPPFAAAAGKLISTSEVGGYGHFRLEWVMVCFVFVFVIRESFLHDIPQRSLSLVAPERVKGMQSGEVIM